MKKMFLRFTAIGFCAFALSACGGGSSSSTNALTNASPGGIWQGTDPVSGLALYGVITESGQFHFFLADGAQYVGTLTTSGDTVSGTLSGYLPSGLFYPDGSTHGTGTVTGTIMERQTISATINYTTANGSSSSDSGSLTFNTLYDSGSSLTTIAGNYRDPETNTTISVDDSGVIFAQDAANGCVVNGQISIIDSQYDAYQVQYSFSSCQGSGAYLNNTTATGLAALDTTVSPNLAYIGVVNTQANYVLTQQFTKE
jgi:hypothetical protein